MSKTLDREQINKLKNKAEKFVQDGKWQKALELYKELTSLDPKNDRLIRRLGDMHWRLKDKEGAKSSYKHLADLYARNGFWAKAISTNKLILEIDPNDNSVQQAIVKLYANSGSQTSEKTEKSSHAEMPNASTVSSSMEEYFPCISLEEAPPAEAIPPQESSPSKRPPVVPVAPAAAVVKPAPPPPPPKDVSRPSGHLDFSTAPEPDTLLHDVIDLGEEVIELEDVLVPAQQIRVPLFSDFGPQELSAIIQKLSVRKLPANSTICEVGQKGDSIFIIASGSAEVSVNGPKNEKLVVAHLRSGEFFGEFGMLSDGKRHATVVTKTPIELLEITKSDLREIATVHPPTLRILDEYYRKRLIDTILRQNELFGELMKEERAAFLSCLELRKVAANTYLFKEGEESGDLYIIKSGSFEVSVKRDNDVVVIARLSAGDFFGEIALINGQKRTATVRAESAGEILFIAKQHALGILHAHASIMQKLQRVVSSRAEDALAAYRSHQELKQQFALV